MVLIITNHYYQSWHPNANRVKGLVRALNKKGLSCGVIQHRTSLQHEKVIHDGANTIYFIDPISNWISKKIHALSPSKIKRGLLWLYRILFGSSVGHSFYLPQELEASDEPIRLIIATGPSFETHVLASKLASDSSIPWIADYRDLWTSKRGRVVRKHLSRRLFDLFERKKEKKIVAGASLLTTVTPLMGTALRKTFPNKEIVIIENGFEEEMHQVSLQNPAKSDLQILYLGSIYHNQDPDNTFFRGLNDFLSHRPKASIKIRFVGTDLSNRTAAIGAARSVLDIVPRVHPSEMVQYFTSSHLCLHFGLEGAEAMATAKVYDYLASRREILYVSAKPGALQEMLNRHSKVHSTATSEEVHELLEHLYARFEKGEDFISPEEPGEIISRKYQSERWADLIVDRYDLKFHPKRSE